MSKKYLIALVLSLLALCSAVTAVVIVTLKKPKSTDVVINKPEVMPVQEEEESEESETESGVEMFVDDITIDNIKQLLVTAGCYGDFTDDFSTRLFDCVKGCTSTWDLSYDKEPTPKATLYLNDMNTVGASVQRFYSNYEVVFDGINYAYVVYHNDAEYTFSPRYIQYVLDTMVGFGEWSWTPEEAAIYAAIVYEKFPNEEYMFDLGGITIGDYRVTFARGVFRITEESTQVTEKINLYSNVIGIDPEEELITNPMYHLPDLVTEEILEPVLEEMDCTEYAENILQMFEELPTPLEHYWYLESDAEFIHLMTIQLNSLREDGFQRDEIAYLSKITGEIFYN